MCDIILFVDREEFVIRAAVLNPAETPALRAAGQAAVLEAMRERLPDGTVAIFGQAAATLYQALAGHRYGDSPCLPPDGGPGGASLDIARYARAHVERMRTKAPAWELGWCVVRSFGEHIQPWLCTVLLDRRGVPVAGAAEYLERVPLK